MTTRSTVKNRSLLSLACANPSVDWFFTWSGRTLLAILLIGLTWLPGLPISSALAAPVVTVAEKIEGIVSQVVGSAEGDRMNALTTCLPKQLSQPNLKRALSEMGNDQIERILSLKADPKLSQAETELRDCLSRKGFTS